MNLTHNRREFLGLAAGGAAALAAGGPWSNVARADEPAQTALPRWRGFNLLSFFQAFSRDDRSDGAISEDDCRWMRDWGFDFVRIPMDYWLWIDSDWRKTRKLKPGDMTKIDERMLEGVDRTVELGEKFGLHVSLNLHRAPGYCINNPEREPLVLWKDKQAEDAFVFHWDLFARRYAGVSPKSLSFNLVNEAPRPRPGYMAREDYCRVMTRATEAIRAHNPRRLVIVDGLSVGNEPIEELIPLGVAQSVHGYRPGQISHYKASWVKQPANAPEPTWPLRNKDGSVKMGRADLEAHYAPWAALARKGVGVHCGECGGYNKTPHPVFLAWFEDVMDILKGYGIGYAMWNFRGSFGILDSGRTDVDYEDWHGHKLDRKLLSVLQKH